MDSKITILGIDPGTNILGFGVICVENKKPRFVDMGVLDLRKEGDSYKKLSIIHDKVVELIDTYRPDNLSIESPFYAKNAQVIFKLGRAQGAAISAAAGKDVPVFEYAPRKAKEAITGNGAASKEQVALMIQRELNVSLNPKYLDATDALALAMCHHYQLHNPFFSAPKGAGGWEKFVAANPDRVK